MASAKKESAPVLERTYNIPLRKEYRKAPNWKRTPKAVRALKQFLIRHMKSEDIRIGNDVNKKLWQHGIKNPPHHVKVTAKKDDKNVVLVSLFGVKETKAKEKKAKDNKKSSVEEKKTPKPKKQSTGETALETEVTA